VAIESVVIIGGGPAGIATAIQLKRYGIEPLLFEQEKIGGLLRNANLVENYPGFPGGIGGRELVELFRKQLETAGVIVAHEKVREIDYCDHIFLIKTDRRQIKSTLAVIATGTTPKTLPHPPIPDTLRDCVFYEVFPLLDIRNKEIAIVGAGDAAFDYALSLSSENRVVILNRSEGVRSLPLLYDRCMARESVLLLNDILLERIGAQDTKVCLTCSGNARRQRRLIKVDYVIVAIGRVPRLEILSGGLMDNYQALIDARKLFLVGDVKNDNFRQTAISVGDGVRAAMDIADNMGRQR